MRGDWDLPGICNAVEDVIAARDILLARETGARAASLPLLHRRRCQDDGDCEGRGIWTISQQRFARITLSSLPMISNVMIQTTR